MSIKIHSYINMNIFRETSMVWVIPRVFRVGFRSVRSKLPDFHRFSAVPVCSVIGDQFYPVAAAGLLKKIVDMIFDRAFGNG